MAFFGKKNLNGNTLLYFSLMFGVTAPLNDTPSRVADLHAFLGLEGAEVALEGAFAFRPRLDINTLKGNRSRFIVISDPDHLLGLDLHSPHDIEVSQDGSMLFAAQLRFPYLSKFDIIKSG